MLALAPSCNKWLDVDNDTNVGADKQFADYEGYRSAVNGVYLTLSEHALYSENLSWGMASVLGNEYDSSTGSNLPKKWKDFFLNPLTNDDSRAIVSPIWERAYNAIANANEILANLENTDEGFFPASAHERDVIKGEMLGVRAMLHLDLLRLFAPSVAADDGKVYIPYVDTYPVLSTTPLTVSKTLERIVADLKEARTLLKYNDTEDEVNRSSIQSPSARFYSSSMSVERFLTRRGLRMNWFAATGILARAYSWAGEKKLAHDVVTEMDEWCKIWYYDGGWFFITDSWNLSSWNSSGTYYKMYDDILMAAYQPEMVTNYGAAFTAGEGMKLLNTNTLFEGELEDVRYAMLTSSNGTISQRWPTAVTSTSQAVVEQVKLAPIIRWTECLYMKMEYLAGTDLDAANTMLSEVRSARDLYSTPSYATANEFLDALHIEMMRGYQTEGQTFFLWKRLNRPLWNGTNPTIDMTGRWVLPLPRSENEYL